MLISHHMLKGHSQSASRWNASLCLFTQEDTCRCSRETQDSQVRIHGPEVFDAKDLKQIMPLPKYPPRNLHRPNRPPTSTDNTPANPTTTPPQPHHKPTTSPHPTARHPHHAAHPRSRTNLDIDRSTSLMRPRRLVGLTGTLQSLHLRVSSGAKEAQPTPLGGVQRPSQGGPEGFSRTLQRPLKIFEDAMVFRVGLARCHSHTVTPKAPGFGGTP